LNFLGAGGGSDGILTDNEDDGFNKDDILPLPTMNDYIDGEINVVLPGDAETA
jgi:hypothetical protein